MKLTREKVELIKSNYDCACREVKRLEVENDRLEEDLEIAELEARYWFYSVLILAGVIFICLITK